MSDSTMSCDDASCTTWIRHTFLQPYRLLHQLRSRMTDEYFSSLIVIAPERDLADKLSSDKIINRLASISPVLRQYLL